MPENHKEDVMFSPEALITQIHDIAHGAPRLEALSNAIQEADAANAHEWRFYFRNEYIHESIFHGDSFKAIICFPELLRIIDEHPEIEEDNEYDLIWTFKNVLENTFDFYQISREEIEHWFEEFKKRSRKYGLSMRMYHMKKCKFYLNADPALVPESYEAFHKERRDHNSDCEACEMHFDMKVALSLGKEEEALRIAQPLLEGRKHCAEVPHETYGELASYYLYKGELEEASYYGTRCERMIGTEPEFLEQTGTLLELYSAVNPPHGWNVLKYSIENFMNCRNPMMRMHFARGAYRLTSVIDSLAQSEDAHYSQNVIINSLPLPKSEKGVHMKDIADYFYNIAKEQCEKLDARNGNTYFMDILRTELKTASEAGEQPSSRPSLHGLVQKQPTAIGILLPDGAFPSMEELAERFRQNVPESMELLSVTPDEEVSLHIMLKKEGRFFEYSLFSTEAPDQQPLRPVAGMTNEELAKAFSANPKKLILSTELGSTPMADYAQIMQIITLAAPELLGVTDFITQHAYPPEWVHYIAKYPEIISAHDLFGLYITGSEELNEVWMCTIGLSCLGMRELEMIGATPENFGTFADMLDETAAQLVERNMLPDAGEVIAHCMYEDEERSLTWGAPEAHAAEGTITAQVNRDRKTAAVLVMTEEGAVLPTALFDYEKEINFPNPNSAFYRHIRLAKASVGEFIQAVQKPFVRASARLEFKLTEEAAEEFGYGIELLWGDVSRVDGDRVYVQIAETSEAVPEIKEGDEFEVTAESVVNWFVQPEGFERPVTAGAGYLLWKEATE